MILDSHKFQSVIFQSSKNAKHFELSKLEIEKAKIKATNTVKLVELL